jgi:hypothetical protein
MFFKKKRLFDNSKYKIDPDKYAEEYRMFLNQPSSTIRELRAVKICMAALIPSFCLLSFHFLIAAIVSGIVTGGCCFYLLRKKISVKPAVAALVSIAIGIIFGGVCFPQALHSIAGVPK